MKKGASILLIPIFIIPIVVIYGMFMRYEKSSDEPTYFDIFIAQTFFKNHKGSPWNVVKESEKRPIEWLIDVKQFETLDSLYLGFRNISNEKIYYMTWGSPNSRIRENFVIYKNGKIDSIPFVGFGCGTGVYLTPLRNREVAGSKILNPLMFNPYTKYHLPLKNEKFPELFRKIYGDSVSIKFEQATYSLPWNSLPSQMIASEEIMVSTHKIIENWKKGKFRLTPESKKEYKLSLFVKEEQ